MPDPRSARRQLAETIQSVVPADPQWGRLALKKMQGLSAVPSALGRLGGLAARLCAIARQIPPPVERRSIVIMAADHGIAAEHVSVYPQEVTAQMVRNFARGGASVNALSKVGKARLLVADLGVKAELNDLVRSGKVLDHKIAHGTANFRLQPAMNVHQALDALCVGIHLAVRESLENDLLATGEKGIGNTTAATAILCALSGADPLQVTGRGTGLDESGRRRKAEIVREALQKHRPDPRDPLDILIKVGGLEIAAMAGFYLGAASRSKPVIVDGFIASSAAMIAQALCPLSTQYMIAAHRSAEVGHSVMLDILGLEPLLNLDFRLGEATGAALCFPLCDAVHAALSTMKTREEILALNLNSPEKFP